MSSIRFSKLSSDFFQFPPRNDPAALPPSLNGPKKLFISADLYQKALDPRLPFTIAALYVLSIFLLNRYNCQHRNKPWNLSKTRLFSCFVILHNILLALYSGWTFLGMWATLRRSVPFSFRKDHLVEIIDSLCKIHGPRGIGESILYNTSTSQWVHQFTMTPRGVGIEELESMGRIWNEGLAFYGWIFYLSKFYEVLDTFILVIKGKRSSTLQTYHHAGAMICMWSGIRYMSPPIWMFVFVNSGIHTYMYTYYTLTALKISVPRILKQSLTTLQILQFIVGSSYAATHSFISYSYFLETPFKETISEDIPGTTFSSPMNTVSSNPLIGRIKMMLTSIGGPEIAPPEIVGLTQIPPSRTERVTVTCLDTTGQNFAIWLNVVYLMPLLFLFVRFFAKSYLRSFRSPSKIERKINQSKLTVKNEMTTKKVK